MGDAEDLGCVIWCFSPPAETLLWFLLPGCVSALSVCWVGCVGWSGVTAGEAGQGSFLLQAQPLLGQHDHLQCVLPVPLCAAATSSAPPWELSTLTQHSRGRGTARAAQALRSSVLRGEDLWKRGHWWPGAGKQWGRG